MAQKGVTMVTQKFDTVAELIISKPGVTAPQQEIEAYVDKQVGTRMRKLRKVMALQNLSEEDVEQEFLLVIVKSMSRFDSAQSSWRTYISRVCDHIYCELMRKHSREISALGNIGHLDVLVEIESDVIPTYEVDFEIQSDVNIVVAKLPERLHEIAELLKTNTPAQTASFLGVSRVTIGRAIKKIREHFLASGFEKLHGDVTN